MNTISLWGLRRLTTSFKRLMWPSIFRGRLPVSSWVRTSKRCVVLQELQWRCYGSKAKKVASLVQLIEGEKDVINLDKVEEGMVAAVSSLKTSFTSAVVTRLNPSSLDKVSVQIEGQTYPLKKVAQLGMPNPQTIAINMSAYPENVGDVVDALRGAKLGLNPVAEKSLIKIPLPKVTGELRESLAKEAKTYGEKAKKKVRTSREKGMSDLKKQEKTISSDSYRRLTKYVQQLADNHTAVIEDLTKAKVTELTKGS